MTFNIEEFDIKLDTEVVGRNFVYIENVDSTNSLLLESEEFDIHGTVLLAEYQKSGKGRKKRDWISNSGENLTFSVLLNENIKQKRVNLINFSATLSLAQSIENLYQLPVSLKWPNDVLVNNKKIAGILLESISKGDKIEKLVVGMGINVNQTAFQGSFNIKPTSVKIESRKNVKRERLLSDVLNNFENLIVRIDNEPVKILSEWKSRCSLIGEKITIIDENFKKFGIFEDIDENGFLLLKSGSYVEKIAFGDVTSLL